MCVCVQEHMPGIKLMYTIGYSLSLAALIMAVTIMVYFRSACRRAAVEGGGGLFSGGGGGGRWSVQWTGR